MINELKAAIEAVVPAGAVVSMGEPRDWLTVIGIGREVTVAVTVSRDIGQQMAAVDTAVAGMRRDYPTFTIMSIVYNGDTVDEATGKQEYRVRVV